MTHKIFHIDTSIQALSNSFTRKNCKYFLDKFQAKFGDTPITYLDLYKDPVPYINNEWVQAANTPLALRKPEQNTLLKTVDMQPLIDCDIYLFGLAGYMYDVPATFKSWMEHMIQFDITVAADWTPLLKNKKLAVVSAWGGEYNSVTPEIGFEDVLRHAFKTVGVTDITFFNIFNTEDITSTADDIEKAIDKYIAGLN